MRAFKDVAEDITNSLHYILILRLPKSHKCSICPRKLEKIQDTGVCLHGNFGERLITCFYWTPAEPAQTNYLILLGHNIKKAVL